MCVPVNIEFALLVERGRAETQRCVIIIHKRYADLVTDFSPALNPQWATEKGRFAVCVVESDESLLCYQFHFAPTPQVGVTQDQGRCSFCAYVKHDK